MELFEALLATAHCPPVPHVDEVGDTVEGRHADVRQGEVDEEVVGDAPHAAVAGSRLGAKSTSKIPHPSKIFVLSYKNILIKEIFHFEASYYGSQHGSHLHLTAPYCTLLHILTFDL